MKKIYLVLFLCTSFSFFFFQKTNSSLMPDNDLYISADFRSLGGISESDFYDVIENIENSYSEIVHAAGANLVIEKNWQDGTVNAQTQQVGSDWVIRLFGGLARHPATTKDSFTLIICHELGHHLGGAPRAGFFINRWASNEGQSDYYSAMKCFRKVFEDDDNIEVVSKMNIDPYAAKACEQVHQDLQTQAICKRISMAGFQLSRLLQDAQSDKTLPPGSGIIGETDENDKRSKTPVSFSTPDPKEVWMTNNKHPRPQCRLDTYFAGALCDKNYEDGLNLNVDNSSMCTRREGYEVGIRPRCWFKP